MSENKTVNEDSPRVNIARYSYVLLAVLVLIIAALTAFFPINNHDIWWHLKTGEYIVSENSIPGHDIYSYTAPGSPWITHEWLAELIFYAIFGIGGINSLIIFKILMAIMIAIILIIGIYKRDVQNPLLFVLLAAAICIGSFRIFVRPHLFTYLFLALFSTAVLNPRYFYRRKIITLLAIPFLFLLWANIHSGFVIGLGIYWTIAIGSLIENRIKRTNSGISANESLKMYILPPLVASIAAIVNPNGVKAFLYPFILASDPVLKKAIAEMISPFEIFSTDKLYWLLLIVIIGFAAFGMIRNLKKRPTLSVILLIGIVSSLISIRNSYEFAIVTTVVLIFTIGTFPRRFSLLGFLVTLILMISFGYYTSDYINNTRGIKLGVGGDFPQQTAGFLNEIDYRGNVYAPLGWGGYLIWSGWPRLKVFIDGRLLIFPC